MPQTAPAAVMTPTIVSTMPYGQSGFHCPCKDMLLEDWKLLLPKPLSHSTHSSAPPPGVNWKQLPRTPQTLLGFSLIRGPELWARLHGTRDTQARQPPS